jgi:hypothetical protein
MADKPDASDQSPADAGQQQADTQPTEELPATPKQSTQELPGTPQATEQAPQTSDQPAQETTQSGAEAPPPPPPVAPPAAAAKKPPRMVKAWMAAVVAGALLLGGGVAGFAIGNAGGHDHRPGYSDRRGPGPDMQWRDGRGGGRFGDRDGGFGDR